MPKKLFYRKYIFIRLRLSCYEHPSLTGMNTHSIKHYVVGKYIYTSNNTLAKQQTVQFFIQLEGDTVLDLQFDT